MICVDLLPFLVLVTRRILDNIVNRFDEAVLNRLAQRIASQYVKKYSFLT